MAAAFVGLNVCVKLKEPPTSLNGLVSNVKGQRLYLTDVHFLKSGKHLKEYIIHGQEIADIEILPQKSSILTSAEQDEQAHAFVPSASEPSMTYIKPLKPTPQSLNHGISGPTQLAPNIPQQLADPAILSFARTPLESSSIINLDNRQSGAYSSLPEFMENGVDANAAHSASRAAANPTLRSSSPALTPNYPATLTTPFNDFDQRDQLLKTDDAHELLVVKLKSDNISEPPLDAASLIYPDNIKTLKKRRKRAKDKRHLDRVNANELDTSPEIVTKGRQSPSDGWRQTPILEQPKLPVFTNQSTKSSAIPSGKLNRQAGASSARKSRRRKDIERNTGNGWATEDASDVHGMGDFDFEANLSKFDKIAVWDELRNDDTTADEDRLVSLNRVKPPIPGTFGGKKLHPSENVLDLPPRSARDIDLGDSDDDLDVGLAASIRTLRDAPKPSMRQHGSRNNSFNAEFNLITPLHATQRGLTSRSLSQAKVSDSQGGASPKVQANASPASSSIISPTVPGSRSEPCLRYTKSDNVCRTMTPETLEAVETLAHDGFGMSEDLLAENAGRGIAEIALSAISPKGHRLGQSNRNSLPVVVILVGDNKTGARALAAARHLLERSVRVVGSLTGSADLENGPLSSQIHRFRGTFLRTWAETSAYLETLDAPPELIIDALRGVQSTYHELDHDHLATVMGMFAWANKSKASVLAVDLPSGIDSSTGTVEAWEGDTVEIRAKIVVCCGAPCASLFEAIVSRRNEDEWVPLIYVADIGINPAARPFLRVNTNSKDSQHRGKYIQFGSEWVVGVRYDAGSTS